MRLALRVAEAAECLGISEDLFTKRVAPELQWVRLGRVKIVAVTELQRWLDESAEHVFRSIETVPMKPGGRPSLKGRRWLVEHVARIAADAVGQRILIEDYGLTPEEIREALSFDARAAGRRAVEKHGDALRRLSE